MRQPPHCCPHDLVDHDAVGCTKCDCRIRNAPLADECPKGGEHHWKFNSGNPVCLQCGEYMPGEPRIVLPATVDEDGTVTVHPPAGIVCGDGDDKMDWQSLERWAKGVFERPKAAE